MSEYIIRGGTPLQGTVKVSGAKNAVLPILSACLLCDTGTVTLENCPDITDVRYTVEILESFGCTVSFENGKITVCAENSRFCGLPDSLTGKLRSSVLFLGAALGRFYKACQSLPGGCKLGLRPIDMHIEAFKKMGVDADCTNSDIICKNRPHGTDIFLPYPSVGATENIMLAAVKSIGTTTVTGAAEEPEIVDLQNFLNSMGANVRGAGTNTVIINGTDTLCGTNYTVMGDRIEAVTFLAGAIATDGEVTVTGADPDHFHAVTDVIINSGGTVCRKGDSVTVKRAGSFILPPSNIVTAPYPGFPTDAQSVITAMLLCMSGTAVISETVFSDRLRVMDEFIKMGADITVDGNTATVRGRETIYGNTLLACDLRSGAALVIAALCAKGESRIKNICYIERGYHDFENKLKTLGADITKIKDREKWTEKTMQ